MTIQLPEHLERYVHEQVLAGRFCSEGEVIFDALERRGKFFVAKSVQAGHFVERRTVQVFAS
jgi:hypothetical protein